MVNGRASLWWFTEVLLRDEMVRLAAEIGGRIVVVCRSVCAMALLPTSDL